MTYAGNCKVASQPASDILIALLLLAPILLPAIGHFSAGTRLV